MSLFQSKSERTRFLKFALVGLSGTVVDFGLLNLLRIGLGIPLIWAQGISFFIAVINNFLWNRFWTYPESRSKMVYQQLLQFTLINIIGLGIRSLLIPLIDRLLFVFMESLKVDLFLDSYIISQNLALATVIGLVMILNYFANRYWTYADVPVGEPVAKRSHAASIKTEEIMDEPRS